MSKVKMIPFVPGHFDFMELREHEVNTLGDTDDDMWRDRLEGLAKTNSVATLIYDGRLLGVIGYVELWVGVIEVYILPSVYVPQYAIIFARKVQDILQQIEDSHPHVHRIQTPAVDDDLHNKWMKFLKFEEEGNMKMFSRNKLDYKMWAKCYGT